MVFNPPTPGLSSSLCVLFADVSNSTRWFEELGDVHGSRVIGNCVRHMSLATSAARGRIIQTLGDGLLATFPAADDAVKASERMMQAVEREAPIDGKRLGIRVGFHFGPVLLGSREIVGGRIDIAGDTVNTAARIQALGKSGQILTSEPTLRQLPAHWQRTARQLDTVSLRGKSESTRIWEILWQQPEDLTVTVTSTVRPQEKPSPRLRLSHQDRELPIPSPAGLSIGREPQNDLVIEDRRISRQHARIESRRDKFVLIDNSTNGSYVTFADNQEVLLRKEELVLYGQGHISLGHSYDSTDQSCVLRFEIF